MKFIVMAVSLALISGATAAASPAAVTANANANANAKNGKAATAATQPTRKVAQQQEPVAAALLTTVRNASERSEIVQQAWRQMVPNRTFNKSEINCEWVEDHESPGFQRNDGTAIRGLLCKAPIGERPFAICASRDGAWEDECTRWAPNSEMRPTNFYFRTDDAGRIDTKIKPTIDSTSGFGQGLSGGAYCYFFGHCAA